MIGRLLVASGAALASLPPSFQAFQSKAVLRAFSTARAPPEIQKWYG